MSQFTVQFKADTRASRSRPNFSPQDQREEETYNKSSLRVPLLATLLKLKKKIGMSEVPIGSKRRKTSGGATDDAQTSEVPKGDMELESSVPPEDESKYATDSDSSTSSRASAPAVEIQDFVRVKKEKRALASKLRAKEMEVESLHAIIRDLQQQINALRAANPGNRTTATTPAPRTTTIPRPSIPAPKAAHPRPSGSSTAPSVNQASQPTSTNRNTTSSSNNASKLEWLSSARYAALSVHSAWTEPMSLLYDHPFKHNLPQLSGLDDGALEDQESKPILYPS
ncbi:unnamed protein product [Hermetia illucens]|uniref:Uncharacterized protein n=1 Tax=Hermetia illucens TaxID=343691 RepID=A0A7R8U9U3_HERIL|nr:unnamed protein product [Hermetia illucens]